MITGGCMCGTVRYRITGQPVAMYHCHCATCRAASGASFVTNVAVNAGDLQIVQGSETLRGYQSSPGKFRYFCAQCGSPIYSHSGASPEYVSVRSGTLADDPGIRPSFHAYYGSKAPWVEVSDGLPRYERERT